MGSENTSTAGQDELRKCAVAPHTERNGFEGGNVKSGIDNE